MPVLPLLAAAAFIGAGASPPPACASARALFAGVRAHTGGKAWDTAKELVADGTGYGEGLPGRTHLAIDLTSGATATTDDLGIAQQRIISSAGETWKQDVTQGVHRLDAPDARAKARTDAYLARRGYFRPATDPASFACLGDVVEDGRALRRVRITPRGGRAVTVWVDPAAYVVVRTQQQAPTHLETVHYGAYRATAGLLLPYEIIETGSAPEETVLRSIHAYRLLAAANPGDFARPPDSANQRITTGAAFTQVPTDDGSGAPVVEAYVDGHGPLPFILDTGGHAILTAGAAKQLGLLAKGGGVSGGAGEGTISEQFARVRSLRIGDAEISDFPMFVIPYGPEFSNRGPGKTPLAGILGLEVFERFAVTIDYGRHTLRLQTPQSYVPAAGDVVVPLLFQDDMPLAYASADGARGLFGVDTGNSGRPFLFGDFVRHHGSLQRYDAGAASQSFGTGGSVSSTSHRLRDLEFGGLVMHKFVTDFVVQQKGSFSSRTEAGNIGHDVLSQFTLTTDYRRGRMYLHREPGAPLPVYTRTGFAGASRDKQGRIVFGSAVPGSPVAEAGLVKGDVILTLDGIPSQSITPAQLFALSRREVGTTLRLTVQHEGEQREVTLIRRELLCNAGAQPCGAWISAAR